MKKYSELFVVVSQYQQPIKNQLKKIQVADVLQVMNHTRGYMTKINAEISMELKISKTFSYG